MMVGRLSSEWKFSSLLRRRTTKNRTIIVGLKSGNYSREMLLRLLNVVVKPGDYVIAIHVQDPFDTFDPNTFHTHEDLCKSKQVDFLIKICTGDSFISELTHQVRVNFATILALGCSLSRPKDSVISTCLKCLPPACSLLIIDNVGRIILQRQGTSQQGSSCAVLQSFPSSSSEEFYFPPAHQLQKSFAAPPSLIPTSIQQSDSPGWQGARKKVEVPNFFAKKLFHRLVILESQRSIRIFNMEELISATENFSPNMVIGEGGNSKVYRAKLEDGRDAAVKVLKTTHISAEDLHREVEILSSMKHENIIKIIGYCEGEDIHAIVCNLLKGSLNQNFKQLKWRERMGVAIGVAKALEYLHCSFNPPIIHRDVKSSNILLSENCQPQLSDFGEAMVYNQSDQVSSANIKPFNVVGTFGYLAPEYMMYGKVDEKIDVYSYGVVLLELITGKEAIQKNQAKQESLVLWARSLLSSGLPEHLIDPCLKDNYVEEEMEIMMLAARLCLKHSSSRRPKMSMILRLFEEPGYWLKIQREGDETCLWRQDDSATDTILSMDDLYHEISFI
ncbi:hypothetical protein P3X46_033515 [Hevea brasiliensis]|uniref:Protein kinase domain-containing protein n=1 Tax=Hevea brasiliensis TaxID=3981 RepID=A0ABQ9KEF3_HEVBR|nr:protein kinase STUNTED [Hevea brasiliensis]KAJ9132675.1 hypothetical protein P3X46_033515 [Hevea brasiliensis]